MASFFRKLLKPEPPAPQPSELSTRPLKGAEGPPQEELVAPRAEPAQLQSACAQSTGKQRDHNEDAVFTLTTMLAGDKGNLPFGLYIVADGMGGHRHGEVASNLAVRCMASFILRKLYIPLLGMRASTPEESIQELMSQAVQEAHHMIMREAPGGGTTLTSALILGGQMMIAHVGDSRAYSVAPNGKLHALTRDHSLVKRLVELGQISVEEAALHPQRNVLYRALGQGEPFEADISTSPIPIAGHILICSDGLWGVVQEQVLSRIIREASSLEQACQQMVEAANEGGGPDNISAILVKMPE
jgi:PPM family protein phosphatase